MYIICPNNKEHNEFTASAHIVQEWVISADNIFLRVENDCNEVTHFPSSDDIITCGVCGAQAITFPTTDVPPVEYDQTDLITTSMFHRCSVCGGPIDPQTTRRLLKGKCVVGWVCLYHKVPPYRYFTNQEKRHEEKTE